jgi:hypothetical protein
MASRSRLCGRPCSSWARKTTSGLDDEVADRLREPHAIAEHVDARQILPQHERGAERPRHEIPDRALLTEQLGDCDGLLAPRDAAAAAGRAEVLQRETGAAQLQIERGQPGRRRLAVHRRERQPGGAERPAKLVARARDPDGGTRLADAEHQQAGDPGERQEPPGGVQRAHAASSTDGTTGSSRR